ncbi:Pollen Ole e 1 allergen and extensin family protein [Quillaja saponaria]|uniref:Pollen Ole e 1 allergen and extensin family protein n=1 Tax=Quillaja saponaria TaxID=32244 RepID=A0AAD7VDQ1_QUISA|nr:Pollen Ole e 1 allergen and extensin family protein [Quillaja saponaria]
MEPLYIAEVEVFGHLHCSNNGKFVNTNTPVLAGVNVTLVSNGGTTILGQALTDTYGFFEVVLDIVDGVLFEPSISEIRVRLPVANCALLPPTGNLKSAISLVGVVQSDVGAVAQFTTGSFSIVI